MKFEAINVELKLDTKAVDVKLDYLKKRIEEIAEMANKAKIEPIEITLSTQIINNNLKFKEMLITCIALKINELTARIEISDLIKNDIYKDGYKDGYADAIDDAEKEE